MERIKHDLRLSETVSPYGVGAVVDVRGESFIAPDTSWWDKRYAPEIHCERLTSQLGPSVLREAPSHSGHAAKETIGLRYWRFPTWRFCERCTRLSRRTGQKKGKWTNTCDCGGHLVPMRYVAVCARGSHIQDIPWFMWAHRGTDAGVTETVQFCKAYKELKFVRSARHGEGLASLHVTCTACKRSRPLSDLTVKGALQRNGIRCHGTQPWEDPTSSTRCDEELVAVPRGATGNYMAEHISALDIPEEQTASSSKADSIRSHMYFEKVVADNGGPQAEMVAGWIADELGIMVEEVLAAAAGEAGVEADEDEPVLLGLKDGEWAAFLKKLDTPGRDDSEGMFVVDSWSFGDQVGVLSTLAAGLSRVGQVRKVREVRALKGFRRYSPEADLIRADMSLDGRRRPVYPAIEVFGEGIFLRFDEGYLAAWENRADVRARADILIGRRRTTQWAQRLDVPEPRYIALHTISHLLIRRLAYASGYSSAALQERIYANSDRPDTTAGILIYTASGDSQGTLGGLVRLGGPDKLIPLLVAALNDADVCSNDPVCKERDHQGSSSLNLAACHGCALTSETSCEAGNRLLDRQLVLGGRNTTGLLEGVLDDVRRLGGGR